MNHLLIYAHPNPKSFNHAIVQTILEEFRKTGKELPLRDLYAMNFSPVLTATDFSAIQNGSVGNDVAAEQELIRAADVLIVVYPLWWSGMPAMLKGYIDRVFSYGFAYEINETGGVGLLTGKKVFLVTTTGASREDYEQLDMYRSFEQTIDSGVFRFSGMEVIDHIYYASVPYVTAEDRKTMLEDVCSQVRAKLLSL
jgi:NAD(P)H dehydrogenase (quinone)